MRESKERETDRKMQKEKDEKIGKRDKEREKRKKERKSKPGAATRVSVNCVRYSLCSGPQDRCAGALWVVWGAPALEVGAAWSQAEMGRYVGEMPNPNLFFPHGPQPFP